MIKFIAYGSKEEEKLEGWKYKNNAKHLGDIIYGNGLPATVYTGREWRIVSKKILRLTSFDISSRRFLAVLALVLSIGLAYLSKTIQELWNKTKESHYIAKTLKDCLFRSSGYFCHGTFSLLQFRNVSIIEQETAIKYFGIEKIIINIGETRFWTLLSQASDAELRAITMENLHDRNLPALFEKSI